MFEIATPMPPADFEINAQLFKVSEIPSILSAFIVSKKHDDICGLGKPALKRVGVAWVNFRCDIKLYVSIAAATSPEWMPQATRINMCCGRSTTLPLIRSK